MQSYGGKAKLYLTLFVLRFRQRGILESDNQYAYEELEKHTEREKNVH